MKVKTRWSQIGTRLLMALSIAALLGYATTEIASGWGWDWYCAVDYSQSPPKCKKCVIWGNPCICPAGSVE